MRIIFSRKGLDAQYGGMPSPILPNGELLPLPIPVPGEPHQIGDLHHPHLDVSQLASDLSRGRLTSETRVHLDPWLKALPRRGRHWRAAFGQAGAAAAHLLKQGVGAGDVFLFFGWFREAHLTSGRWHFVPRAPDLHVVFGYLQVADVVTLPHVGAVPPPARPFRQHPHVAGRGRYRNGHNVLFTASPALAAEQVRRGVWPAAVLPGAGLLHHLTASTQLTANGLTRSRWQLPLWMLPSGERRPLTYHADPRRWHVHGHYAHLRSVSKGQEFVLHADDYPPAAVWLMQLLVENG